MDLSGDIDDYTLISLGEASKLQSSFINTMSKGHDDEHIEGNIDIMVPDQSIKPYTAVPGQACSCKTLSRSWFVGVRSGTALGEPRGREDELNPELISGAVGGNDCF